MRRSEIVRNTRETEIKASLNLDGQGISTITTPIPFFNHMLETLSKHSRIDLDLEVKGDVHIDQHHTVEDTGLVLGMAIKKALGDKKGINRAGFFVFPMDEALGLVSLDIGGRVNLQFQATFQRQFCGDFDLDSCEDFFSGLSQGLGANLAVRVLSGRSDHHKVEALFKALAKALAMAISFDEGLKDYLPSTKGVIE